VATPLGESLLTAKLYVPPPRPNRVARERLASCLDDATGGMLALVSAPAGFGKSTLLSDWVHGRQRPVAWVSLDRGDNDPVRFLGYLVTALRAVHSGLGEEALAVLRAPAPPDPAAVLTGLLNEILALPEDVVLILDDYHEIEARPVHDVLQFVLDHLPRRLLLVVATRVDPPLSLSRLRARGQLVELRAADLRFTGGEAATFLNEVMGLSLTSGEIAALDDRTEGWAAGLQMAALSLRGREDSAAFIEHFTGSHRYILDYLTDEVLSRQPAEVRDFLLDTSILERLSGPLCDAVSGRGDSQGLLEDLESANLFLIPLDDERRWFRWHHLFGTLLAHQLERRSGKEGVAERHRRACAWYAAHGFPEDALEHALAAGDLDRATGLVEAHALPRLIRGDARSVLRWISALPPERVAGSSWLSIVLAWTLISGLRIHLAEARIRDAELALAKGGTGRGADGGPADPELLGHIDVLRGVVLNTDGRPHEALERFRSALERLTPESFGRGAALLQLGISRLILQDLEGAERHLHESLSFALRHGHLLGVLISQWYLGRIAWMRGRLRTAVSLYEDGIRMAGQEGGRPGMGAYMFFSGLSEVRWEMNELSAAEDLATQAMDQGRRAGLGPNTIPALLVLARLRMARDDFDGARHAIADTAELMGHAIPPFWEVLHDAYLALFRLARTRRAGETLAADEALRWAHSWSLLPEGEPSGSRLVMPSPFYELVNLTALRSLLAAGRIEDGLRRLALLRERHAVAGFGLFEVECRALEARIRLQQGDEKGASETLARALVLAEPEGTVRIFLEEGPELIPLLEKAVARGESPAFARRLLAAFGSPAAAPPVQRPAPAPAASEALSEREVEVLRLIAGGLSNSEVGRKLFIAPSTVKKHLENVYGKLAVRNRTEAVTRAREMGLM
jgi:LuxR family maltose regulon positive regulatory protein